MSKQIRISLSIAAILSMAGLAAADPLTIQTAGVFSGNDSQTGLASPGSAWQLMFIVNSQPAATNAAADGFDVPFSGFSYRLNGSPVAVSPDSIRLYGAANTGLFTVFFGPESGTDSSGNFIPEFTFSGPQLFSGSPQDPVISPGSFAVSEWLYTDTSNYDDQLDPGTTVTVGGTNTVSPEPASLSLFLSALALGYGMRRIGTKQ